MRSLALVIALVSLPVLAEDLAEVNKPVPTFRLPVYNPKEFGQPTVSTDTYVGLEATDTKTKTLMVSFMASFCAPCKKELPVLQKLHEKYKDQGLRVLSVAIDTEPEGQAKIAELLTANAVTLPVAKDRFNIVARRWLGSQSPLPSLFMVRPDGTVSAVHRGYSQDGALLLEQEVASALGLPPPPPPAPEVVAPPPAPEPAPAPAAPAVKPKAKTKGKK